MKPTAEPVKLSKLKHHPKNPRRGDVEAIMDSLVVNGQYKPVLVQSSTGYIIAGNHTVKAAKRLGWHTVSVIYRDCTDSEALEILVADNRASDTSYSGPEEVFRLLAQLPSLDGTGYERDDIRLPRDLTDPIEPLEPPSDSEPLEEQPEARPKPYTLKLGNIKGYIDVEAYEAWRANLPRKNSEALDECLQRLGIYIERTAPQGRIITGGEVVPIGMLVPHPENPRHGDTGTLMTMLQEFGQTRPVVVNKRNRRIIAGNHVAFAADQLGWTELWVVWVDVDEEAEKRILLVDNRTQDLATYDTFELGRTLASLDPRMITACGFSLEDLDSIMAGDDLKEPASNNSEVAFIVGPYLKTKLRVSAVRALGLPADSELSELARRLGFSQSDVMVNVNDV